MSNPVDPIEAIDGVSSSSKSQNAHFSAHKTESTKKESDLLFECNYVLIVMKMTDEVMKHQSQSVEEQGNLQQVLTKIQGDMNTITQFISTIESKVKTTGSTVIAHGDGWGCHDASPNSTDGLDPDFFHMNDYTFDKGWGLQQNFGGDSGNDLATGKSLVSQGYKDQMKSFITAIKELFYSASPVGSDITVADLSKIQTSSGTFDLNQPFGTDKLSFWDRIGNPISALGYDRGNFSVISSKPTDKPSLLQQYAYYKAKSTVQGASQDDIKKAGGDIWKLKGMDFNPDDGCDQTMRSALGVLANLNTSVTIQRSWVGDSSNILDLMIQDSPQLYNTKGGSLTWAGGTNFDMNKGDITPGLYTVFAELAFNYGWTKNPNASADAFHSNYCVNQDYGVADFSNSGWDGGGALTVGSDTLSAVYLSANSAQTGLTSTGTTMGQDLNQKVADTQSMNDSMKQMINNFTQGQGSTVNNFKS